MSAVVAGKMPALPGVSAFLGVALGEISPLGAEFPGLLAFLGLLALLRA